MVMKAMNVSRVLAIMMIVLMASGTMAALQVSAKSRVIRVPRDFSTIQDAVNFASPGDTIIVGPGEYYGANVNKPVKIRGAGAFIVTAFLWKEFKLLSFDPEFGAALGFPIRALETVLTSLLVIAAVRLAASR